MTRALLSLSTTMPSLRRLRRDDVTFADAVADCSFPDGAIVLGWSSNEVVFGRVDDGQMCDSAGDVINSSRWFEGRVFDSERELRWLHERNGSGAAVLIGESMSDLTDDWRPITTEARASVHGVQTILWGRSVTRDSDVDRPGWTRFSAARIGTISVPIETSDTKQSAALTTIEYLVSDSDGNAFVLDTRLTGLQVLGMGGQSND